VTEPLANTLPLANTILHGFQTKHC
jgi:hypothetical protein